MSKRHTVTLHHMITVYNDMFNQMDGVMQALANKKPECKEDMFCAVKLARPELPMYYDDLNPMTAVLVISAHIINVCRQSQSFRKRDMAIDGHPEDQTSYNAQWKEAFLKYVVHEQCAKHRRVPVNDLEYVPHRNIVPSGMASGSGQSLFESYDLSRDDEEYLTPDNVAETTTGQSDGAACLLTATRLYFK